MWFCSALSCSAWGAGEGAGGKRGVRERGGLGCRLANTGAGEEGIESLLVASTHVVLLCALLLCMGGRAHRGQVRLQHEVWLDRLVWRGRSRGLSRSEHTCGSALRSPALFRGAGWNQVGRGELGRGPSTSPAPFPCSSPSPSISPSPSPCIPPERSAALPPLPRTSRIPVFYSKPRALVVISYTLFRRLPYQPNPACFRYPAHQIPLPPDFPYPALSPFRYPRFPRPALSPFRHVPLLLPTVLVLPFRQTFRPLRAFPRGSGNLQGKGEEEFPLAPEQRWFQNKADFLLFWGGYYLILRRDSPSVAWSAQAPLQSCNQKPYAISLAAAETFRQSTLQFESHIFRVERIFLVDSRIVREPQLPSRAPRLLLSRMAHATCITRASSILRASPLVPEHAPSRSQNVVPVINRLETPKTTVPLSHPPRTPAPRAAIFAAIPAASLLAALPASAAAALAEESPATDKVRSAVGSLLTAAEDLERAAASTAGVDKARSAVGSLVSAAEDLKRAAVSAYRDVAGAGSAGGDTAQFDSAVGDIVSATGDLERAAVGIFGKAVSAEESVSEQVGKLLGSGVEATQKLLESSGEALQADTAGVTRMIGDAASAGLEAVERLFQEGAPALDGVWSLSLPTNGTIFNTVSSASAFVTAPLSTAWEAVQLTPTSSGLQTVAFYASMSVFLLAIASQPRE
ncbi:unnamed protein product [Closterium sp. NIES-53]